MGHPVYACFKSPFCEKWKIKQSIPIHFCCPVFCRCNPKSSHVEHNHSVDSLVSDHLQWMICQNFVLFHSIFPFVDHFYNCSLQLFWFKDIVKYWSKNASNIESLPILKFDHGRLQPIFSTIQLYAMRSRLIEFDISHCLLFLLRSKLLETSTFLNEILQFLHSNLML